MHDDQTPTDELRTARAPAAQSAVDEPPIAAGRRLGDRYVLEHRLGHGGMAVVWLAIDERLDRRVAVKVLSDTLSADHDYLGRFEREAQVAASLQHPNLVSVYDYDAGARPYLVMEYIEGGDLARRLRQGEAPSAEQLATELLAALRHIHAAGVLHRDIKPHNVLIDSWGHARLTDFGIARPADASSLTRTGEVIGTETYLAPELMRGEPASERSDLYSLGVLLAGIAAETGGAGASVLALADRMRADDPQARPESAAAALDELEGDGPVIAGEPTQPFAIRSEPSAAPRAPTPRPEPAAAAGGGRGSRILALGAITAIAVLAIVFVVMAGGEDGSERGELVAGGAGTESRGQNDQGGGGSGGQDETTSEAPAEPAPADEAEPAPETVSDGGGSGDPAALNDQGFALIGQGSYEEAVPVLEQAVDGLRDSGDDTTYNYALFNLATAYLESGRPADAIPLLEERMQFDDGQLGEVQAALDRAYAESGTAPSGEAPADEPGNGPKPGKGPKSEKVPPAFEGDDD